MNQYIRALKGSMPKCFISVSIFIILLMLSSLSFAGDVSFDGGRSAPNLFGYNSNPLRDAEPFSKDVATKSGPNRRAAMIRSHAGTIRYPSGNPSGFWNHGIYNNKSHGLLEVSKIDCTDELVASGDCFEEDSVLNKAKVKNYGPNSGTHTSQPLSDIVQLAIDNNLTITFLSNMTTPGADYFYANNIGGNYNKPWNAAPPQRGTVTYHQFITGAATNDWWKQMKVRADNFIAMLDEATQTYNLPVTQMRVEIGNELWANDQPYWLEVFPPDLDDPDNGAYLLAVDSDDGACNIPPGYETPPPDDGYEGDCNTLEEDVRALNFSSYNAQLASLYLKPNTDYAHAAVYFAHRIKVHDSDDEDSAADYATVTAAVLGGIARNSDVGLPNRRERRSDWNPILMPEIKRLDQDEPYSGNYIDAVTEHDYHFSPSGDFNCSGTVPPTPVKKWAGWNVKSKLDANCDVDPDPDCVFAADAMKCMIDMSLNSHRNANRWVCGSDDDEDCYGYFNEIWYTETAFDFLSSAGVKRRIGVCDDPDTKDVEETCQFTDDPIKNRKAYDRTWGRALANAYAISRLLDDDSGPTGLIQFFIFKHVLDDDINGILETETGEEAGSTLDNVGLMTKMWFKAAKHMDTIHKESKLAIPAWKFSQGGINPSYLFLNFTKNDVILNTFDTELQDLNFLKSVLTAESLSTFTTQSIDEDPVNTTMDPTQTIGKYSIVLFQLDDEDGIPNGMPDSWEDAHGIISLDNPDDSDGLNNLDEYKNETDPHVADTDGDGLDDYEEVGIEGTGTDPLDPDHDDDGLTDFEEVNTYGLNPLDADYDDDGLNDGDEINVYNTDPFSGILSTSADEVLPPPDERTGNDVIAYGTGDGNDTIVVMSPDASSDLLLFECGDTKETCISYDEVVFERDPGDANGLRYDLKIKIDTDDDTSNGYENTITIENFFAIDQLADVMNFKGVDFADDTHTAVSSNGIWLSKNDLKDLAINTHSQTGCSGDLGDGDDDCIGTSGADSNLDGTSSEDVIFAREGADWVKGKSNADTLYGEKGNDVLAGNSGDDLIFGDKGRDTLNPGAGYDQMDGGAGRDTYQILATHGMDNFIYNIDMSTPDICSGCKSQYDLLKFMDNIEEDEVTFSLDPFDDTNLVVTIDEDEGSNTSEVVLYGYFGPFANESSLDFVFKEVPASTVIWDGRCADSDLDNDGVLEGAADVRYEYDAARIGKEPGCIRNRLLRDLSTPGDDVIKAFGTADFVDAGDGNDLIIGYQGDDYLVPGNGNDIIDGERGNDRYEIAANASDVDVIYNQCSWFGCNNSGDDTVDLTTLVSSDIKFSLDDIPQYGPDGVQGTLDDDDDGDIKDDLKIEITGSSQVLWIFDIEGDHNYIRQFEADDGAAGRVCLQLRSIALDETPSTATWSVGACPSIFGAPINLADLDTSADVVLYTSSTDTWEVSKFSAGVSGPLSDISAGLPANPEFLARADFDGDEDADLLLLDGTTYKVCMYEDGFGYTCSNLVDDTTPTPLDVDITDAGDWVFDAACDWDGDGDSDILVHGDDSGSHSNEWRIYYIENGVVLSGDTRVFRDESHNTLTSSYVYQGCGDFDGDGDFDLLVRKKSSTTRPYRIFYSHGDYETKVKPTLSSGKEHKKWKFQGTGDFDGDGDWDILVRRFETGKKRLWKVWTWESGDYEATFTIKKAGTGNDWMSGDNNSRRRRSVADYTGDGIVDILIRKKTNPWNVQLGQISFVGTTMEASTVNMTTLSPGNNNSQIMTNY